MEVKFMGKTIEYPAEFKLKAVKTYLEGNHGGYQKVSEIYGMKDTRCLRKWVKQYEEKGEKFFKDKKVAKKEFMYKTPQSYEEKIQYLEAENAYLKELLGITSEKVKKKKNTK